MVEPRSSAPALDLFRLDSKVALVTGASTGLGQAMAVALAQAGADVVGAGSSGNFAETKAGVEEAGRRFAGVQADLSKMEDVRKLVPATVDQFGRVDILVNNAGIIRRSPCVDFSEEDWDAVINVNLKAAFFLSQAAAREFDIQKSGGKIINVTSLLSFQGGIRMKKPVIDHREVVTDIRRRHNRADLIFANGAS